MLPILARREFMQLGKACRKMDEILHWPDARFYSVQEEVSLWSPAQELYHISIVGAAIFDRIEMLYADESKDILYKGRPNKEGWLILTFGKIPRDRAKAPPQFEPPPEVTRSEVRGAMRMFKNKMNAAAPNLGYLYEVKGRIPHRILGNFSALQWLKFARIHSLHHLQVAEEIGKEYLSRSR